MTGECLRAVQALVSLPPHLSTAAVKLIQEQHLIVDWENSVGEDKMTLHIEENRLQLRNVLVHPVLSDIQGFSRCTCGLSETCGRKRQSTLHASGFCRVRNNASEWINSEGSCTQQDLDDYAMAAGQKAG